MEVLALFIVGLDYLFEAIHVCLFLLGSSVIAYGVGRRLVKEDRFWTRILAGSLMIAVLLVIPIVGILGIAILYLAAIGLSGILIFDEIQRLTNS